MNEKKKLLIIVVIFVILVGGASVLYTQLSKDMAPDQLTAENDSINMEETDIPEEENSVEDSIPEDENQGNTDAEEPELMLAPDFGVYDADDNPVKFSDYTGKPIVLNFWASWCGPCKSEMPHFNEKYLELGEEIQFLMVNMTTSSRESEEKAKSYVADHGFEFPVLYDLDSEAATTYGVYSLPTTYFIDADGYLIAHATGAIDGDTLQRGIDMIK